MDHTDKANITPPPHKHKHRKTPHTPTTTKNDDDERPPPPPHEPPYKLIEIIDETGHANKNTTMVWEVGFEPTEYSSTRN